MEIENKLNALGFELPVIGPPAGTYISSVQVDNLLFVGGNIGRLNGEPLKYKGQVGDAVTIEQAYEMARNVALNHLSKIKTALGDLDQVERIVQVTGFVSVAPGFFDMPKVINGESDLLVQLWGEKGEHTRIALGISALGGNAPVEIEVIVQAKS